MARTHGAWLNPMDYQSAEYALAASLLVCSMFGMGTTLTVSDIVRVFKQPSGLVIVLFLQCVAAPMVAVLLAALFRVSEGVAIGMLLVAALPGGSYTNLFTYLGKGNVALSVAATTCCTALCVVTTPTILQVFGSMAAALGVMNSGTTGHVEMPAQLIFSEIGSWLLAPLAAGMLVRRLFPSHYSLPGKIAIWISFGLLVVLIGGAAFTGRLKILSEGLRAPLAIAAFGSAMLWITYGTCLLARRTIKDVFTIAIEVVVRNGNLALLLKASLYPDGGDNPAISSGVLYAILFYVSVALFIATLEVRVCRTHWGVIYGRGRP
jgi:BASS family bile acid:Na+ symporter